MLDLAVYVGMSPADYWHGDPRLLNSYIEAHNKRKQDNEYLAWLTGAYVKAALQTTPHYSIPVFGKMPKLPDYPSPPLQEEPVKREITDAEKIAFQHDLYMRYKALVNQSKR